MIASDENIKNKEGTSFPPIERDLAVLILTRLNMSC